MHKDTNPNDRRDTPLNISPNSFREAGHWLVDQIAELLQDLPERPVTHGEKPQTIQEALGNVPLPKEGKELTPLLKEAVSLLFNHSLFNGHPKFLGYITSSAAPIGFLAEMLAASVNANVGGWELSPIASEIESQTVRWLAEMVGYPTNCGGLLVSGGNMANMVGFLAARYAKTNCDIREKGFSEQKKPLTVYASVDTHTWLQKAADMTGLGTNAIQWIPVDKEMRMDIKALRQQVQNDIKDGKQPFMVVGTAGSVSTGAIDPLPEIEQICRAFNLWFHVDGAYGAFAAALPDASINLRALSKADSLALDPHKWLYAPLEAGCVFVRDAKILFETFSYRPSYYKFDETDSESPISYFEYGPQNSRGFKALKVWLALKQAGLVGYQKMIAEDIRLSKYLFQLVDAHQEFQARSQNLSITTFRYLPKDFDATRPDAEDYLNKLNTEILTRLQKGGEAFVSNAVIDEKYFLRACIVNFRTSEKDINALPEIIARKGREVYADLKNS